MSDFGIVQHYLTTIEMDGKPCAVSVRIAYDGIEYIGRLFFADPVSGEGIPDHGAIPGRTVEEAVEFARRLTLERRAAGAGVVLAGGVPGAGISRST